jgi:hypothetical protein
MAAVVALPPIAPASASLLGDHIVITRVQGGSPFKTDASTVGSDPEYIDNFFTIDVTENEVRFDTFGNLSLGQIDYTIDGLDFDDNASTPNIVTSFFSKQIFGSAAKPFDIGGVTISPSGQLRVSFANTVTGADGFASVTLGAPTPTAVPEPASWAMMIGGFALAGSAARRRATRAVVCA